MEHTAAHRPSMAIGGSAALFAACCMSAYVLIGENSTRNHDASGFLLLRQLLATCLMVLVAGARHGFRSLLLVPFAERSDVRTLGFLQFTNAVLFLHGVQLAGSFVAAVCQLAIPVLTFAYTAMTGVERYTTRRAAAMFVVVMGCALTTCGHAVHEAALARAAPPTSTAMPQPGRQLFATLGNELPQSAFSSTRLSPPPSPSPKLARSLRFHQGRKQHHQRRQHRQSLQTATAMLPSLGGALLLLQCCSFVGIVLVQRRVLRVVPVSLVVLWSYVLATAYTALYCLCMGSLGRLHSQLASASDMLAIVVAAVVGSVFYFEAVAIATKHLPPTLVACSVALEPLAVSALGAAFLGHITTPVEMCGYMFASLGACALAALTEPDAGGSTLRRKMSDVVIGQELHAQSKRSAWPHAATRTSARVRGGQGGPEQQEEEHKGLAEELVDV